MNSTFATLDSVEPSADEVSFLALSRELYCTVDVRTGDIRTLRGAWATILGHSDADLQAKPLWSLVHVDDAEAVRMAFEVTADSTEQGRFLGRLCSKNGAYRTLEWTTSAASKAGLVHAAARDVTDLREAREQAQSHEELLGQVARGAPVVIAAYEPDGTISVHIGAGLEKLGLQQNQLRGVSVFDAFRGADEALGHIRAALEGKQATNTQDLGGTIWDNWFSPRLDARGVMTGAISISTDVTERERTRQALEDRLRVIEEQGRAIRVMSAPIIEVWQGVLVIPVVGQLGAESAADVMERLLSVVVERGATHAILDLTAVDRMETTTAEHLLRMIQALGLLGTKGLLSGLRPSVARALIELGIDLSQVRSLSSLHAALRACMTDMPRGRSAG